jgi:hypothetical protein
VCHNVRQAVCPGGGAAHEQQQLLPRLVGNERVRWQQQLADRLELQDSCLL